MPTRTVGRVLGGPHKQEYDQDLSTGDSMLALRGCMSAATSRCMAVLAGA